MITETELREYLDKFCIFVNITKKDDIFHVEAEIPANDTIVTNGTLSIDYLQNLIEIIHPLDPNGKVFIVDYDINIILDVRNDSLLFKDKLNILSFSTMVMVIEHCYGVTLTKDQLELLHHYFDLHIVDETQLDYDVILDDFLEMTGIKLN